jgi:hypothetical protein
MAEVPASVRTLAADRRFTQVRPAGSGVEFQVFEATAPDGSKIVLRTPVGERFQSSPNDRNVDTRSLLRWEYVVTRHLGQLGFPVATPRELVLGEPDVLVSDFVADDGRGAGAVCGLLDWSNALLGDPAMELGRLAEYALLPQNGIDYEAVLDGYREPVPADSAAFWIYRLDAAVMLALLFNSEASHAELGPPAADRLREVHLRLVRELSK